MRPIAGVTFGRRYELSSRVAIGGMGEVWEATDLVIGRPVAIKILKDEYLGDPGFLERFRAEARHAALVNHEGIANVYDYGEEDGSAFLVMELVPGEPLSTILEREHSLPPDRVLDIVAQTATALQAAHAAGLVHRDIKPGNMLITPEGRVKITDFGIARIADQVPLTATGQVMGTVQYLSPEQASGRAASPATDIYSLGIVAYEALAGRRPFTGESQVAIAMAQINETPPDLPASVPEPVRRLVMACIAKAPSERPTTSALLARAAQALRRGDVLAAASAVPAVLPAGVAAPTMTMQTEAPTTRVPTSQPGFETTMFGAAAPTRSTTAYAAPQTGAVPPRTLNTPVAGGPDEQPPRRRSGWTVPLIALIVILAIAIGFVLVTAAGKTSGASPSGSASTHSTTKPSASKSTAAPTSVDIGSSDDYTGKTYQEVDALLKAKGMVPNNVAGQATSDSSEVGTVYALSRVGTLTVGSSINVQYYTAQPAPDAPSSAPTVNAPASADGVDPGTQFTVGWTSYNSCPAGTSRTGYEVKVTGAADASNATTKVSVEQSPTITAGDDGTIKVKYKVFCGDGNDSAYSPTLSVPVKVQKAEIDESAYVGKPYQTAVAALQAEGFTNVTAVASSTPADTTHVADTVESVDPSSGMHELGTTITVTYYAASTG